MPELSDIMANVHRQITFERHREEVTRLGDPSRRYVDVPDRWEIALPVPARTMHRAERDELRDLYIPTITFRREKIAFSCPYCGDQMSMTVMLPEDSKYDLRQFSPVEFGVFVNGAPWATYEHDCHRYHSRRDPRLAPRNFRATYPSYELESVEPWRRLANRPVPVVR